MARTNVNCCLTLPAPLIEALDAEARAQDRPRSYVARKLLERSLTGPDRLAALEAVADAGLEDYAAGAARERSRNPAEIVAAASTDGQRMLDAHREIAAGSRKATT
jgi:predicted transcriptional regulator